MIANAVQFNVKNSVVYRDAFALRDKFYDVLSEDAPELVMNASMQASPVQQRSKKASAVKGEQSKTTEWKGFMKKIAMLRDGTGRLISELFAALPDAGDYPDYYHEVHTNIRSEVILQIKNPISMAEINKRIASKEYLNTDELLADFNLMCNNAMLFNAEGSQVYEDAQEIQVTTESTSLYEGTLFEARRKG
jgi:Bromodomain